MEFPNLGKHCSLEECGERDFLPFKCDRCQKDYCLEHRTYKAHQCSISEYTLNPSQPVFCPICNRSIPIPAGADVNAVLIKHMDAKCPKTEGERRREAIKRKNKCYFCGKSDLTPVICKICKHQFCMRHRLEMDHQCGTTKSKKGLPPANPSLSNPDGTECAPPGRCSVQ